MNLLLVIRGSVPSFKNHKMLTRGRLITDPVKQKWMQGAQRDIESQLFSGSAIIDGVTQPVCWKQLRMWLSGLSDDSVREIPEGSWRVVRVPKGQEGADIVIEELP